jgi:MFS family permease
MSTALRTDSIARSRIGWGFVLLYAAAYVGTWLALLTPIMVTLALRVQELAPNNAANALSLVLSVGALFALFGNPLCGRLSDRTTSSWGMRRPWLIAGAVGGLASLWLISVAPTITWVLVGWCLVQFSFNAVLAPLAALLPDQIPLEHRGTVAGVLSTCTCLGQMAGTGLTNLVSVSTMAMFLVPGVVGVAAILLLAVVLPDRRLQPDQREPLRWRDLLRSVWINPRRYPDFACIWAGRFFLMMGMSFLLAYQPFYLMSQLHVAARDVADIVFQSTVVQGITFFFAGVASGKLSDLTGRRKPFVIGAAVIYAGGALIVALAHSFPVFFTGMALTGVGLGTYLAVDLALITDVLPDRDNDAAKDLGVFNIASTLPQFVAPLAATVILAVSGQSYAGIFLAVAVAGLLGALVILPVKGAR